MDMSVKRGNKTSDCNRRSILRRLSMYAFLFVAMLLLIGLTRYLIGYGEDGNLLVNSIAAGLLTLIILGLRFIIRRGRTGQGCKASVGNVDMAVPYTSAQHYFVRNDVEGLPPTEITTRDEFDKYFGMAAVMGPGGMPTEIDFNKYFVVCLTMPPTDRAADLSVESLRRTKSGELELRYKLRQGEKRSYTIRPLILLMVDKKYQMPVRLEEI